MDKMLNEESGKAEKAAMRQNIATLDVEKFARALKFLYGLGSSIIPPHIATPFEKLAGFAQDSSSLGAPPEISGKLKKAADEYRSYFLLRPDQRRDISRSQYKKSFEQRNFEPEEMADHLLFFSRMGWYADGRSSENFYASPFQALTMIVENMYNAHQSRQVALVKAINARMPEFMQNPLNAARVLDAIGNMCHLVTERKINGMTSSTIASGVIQPYLLQLTEMGYGTISLPMNNGMISKTFAAIALPSEHAMGEPENGEGDPEYDRAEAELNGLIFVNREKGITVIRQSGIDTELSDFRGSLDHLDPRYIEPVGQIVDEVGRVFMRVARGEITPQRGAVSIKISTDIPFNAYDN